METTKLRALISTEAKRLGGSIWPNGIGFDYRTWMYQYRRAHQPVDGRAPQALRPWRNPRGR